MYQFTPPVAASQGEIGASSVEGNYMKTKLKFANHRANKANGLLVAILKKLRGPFWQIFFSIIHLYAIMHRTTSVQN